MPCPSCCTKREDAGAPTYVKCNFGKSSCGGSAPARSPCGICEPISDPCSSEQSSCDRFAGSFLVDTLAAVIFFFFWMMQFWLNMANCLYRGILCLINADRPIQLVVAGFFILIFGSMFLTGLFKGGDSCIKCKDSKIKMSSCGYPRSCNYRASSSSSKGSEAQLKQQKKLQQQNQQQKQQQKQQQDQQRKKESISGSSSATSQKSSPTFKIKCKDSKNACAGPIDKKFYLTITDEKKKKLYEASAHFSLLTKDQKPKLLITTDPIILENY